MEKPFREFFLDFIFRLRIFDLVFVPVKMRLNSLFTFLHNGSSLGGPFPSNERSFKSIPSSSWKHGASVPWRNASIFHHRKFIYICTLSP